MSRHWPANTLADSSRLYSPAMARLTPLTMVETGEPSFSNCSAQYADLDAGAAADVLVVRAFVGILKAAPAADVVDQDRVEVRLAGLDIAQQPLQGFTAINAQTTLALIGVGANDLDASLGAYSRILSAWFSVEYC